MSGRAGRWQPRLWMLLTGLGLFAVVAGVGGLSLVRVYDNQLVRQTESELLTQGVAVAEIWRDAVSREGVDPATYGVARLEEPERSGELTPYLPTLRASGAMPAPAEPPRATVTADAPATHAGQALSPVLREVSSHTLAGIRVTDSAGVVVAASYDQAVGTTLADREEVRRALRGLPASMLRERSPDPGERALASLSRDNAVRVIVAVPVVNGGRVWGTVVLARTPLTLAKAVYGDRWNLTATVLVLFSVVALVSLVMSALVVRPLRALVRQTRSIGAGDQAGSAPISRPVVHELAELSTSLASMAQLLTQRADYIRNFTASVSHEFKTPLSSIRGAVELLEESADKLSPEQRAKFLGNIAADAQRLTRLVERLLVLAKAEVGSPTAARTEVAPVLRALADRWTAQGMSLELAEAQGVVAMPAEALDACVNHLLENARHHAGAGATVTLRAAVRGEAVELDVRDDGPGISEANRPKVFDAFFTTARATGGTGLGLTISHALVRAFGGSLTVVPHEGRGAWFRLALPGSR